MQAIHPVHDETPLRPRDFPLPLDEVDPAIVPTGASPDTPEFEQAVIMHYALRYAAKGWQAIVTVNDGFVERPLTRSLAVWLLTKTPNSPFRPIPASCVAQKLPYAQTQIFGFRVYKAAVGELSRLAIKSQSPLGASPSFAVVIRGRTGSP